MAIGIQFDAPVTFNNTVAGAVKSLAKSGSTALTGAVTLTGGSNVTLTQAGQDISIAATGGGGGGTQLDYVTTTSDLTISATSSATAQTYVTGTSLSYDGSTRVLVEFWTALINTAFDAVVELYDGSTDIGRIAQYSSGGGSCHGMYFVTPSAGSHQFIVKVWRAGGNGSIFGSLGCPSFLRISTA